MFVWLGVLAMTAIPGVLCAQEDGNYSVGWIGQFPDTGREGERKWGERFSAILFGEKQMALVKPFGVVADGPGDLWVLDQGAGTFMEVEQGSERMSRALSRSKLSYPSLVGVCRGGEGELYFTDSRLNRFFRLKGDGIGEMSGADELLQPTGIAYHPGTGEIWVSETAGHRIAVFDREGRLLRRIGKRGPAQGEFNFPTFLWIDAAGRIYVVDSMNFRVQVLDSSGNFLFCFGENGDGTGQMARPKGVATDSHGNIYLADALFHVVQVFDREGRYLANFGGQGRGEGEFWMPAGVYIDSQDRIYVADSYNARVQIFQLETQ